MYTNSISQSTRVSKPILAALIRKCGIKNLRSGLGFPAGMMTTSGHHLKRLVDFSMGSSWCASDLGLVRSTKNNIQCGKTSVHPEK